MDTPPATYPIKLFEFPSQYLTAPNIALCVYLAISRQPPELASDSLLSLCWMHNRFSVNIDQVDERL